MIMESQGKKLKRGRVTPIKLMIIIFLGLLVASLHFFTPIHVHSLHLIFDRLCYLPVILSAYWFGLWGGIGMGICMSLMHLTHIWMQWGGSFWGENLYQTLEAFVHLFLGLVTGFLSERFLNTSEKLEQSYRDLQEKTRLILNAEEQLKRTERIQSLAELSAGVAHEIRTPLSSIKGAADILAHSQLTAEQRKEFTDILVEESRHLNRIVNQFLDFARPKQLTELRCHLQGAIETVLELTEHQRKIHAITVSQSYESNLPAIVFDPDQLKQVFVNLITNAIQSMPNGGEIRITCKKVDKQAICWVEDSGTGIPESNLLKIFDPFFTTRKNGTGLGLSIVQKILQHHKAQIEVSNRKEGGACFQIMFCCHEEEGE